MDRTSWGLRKNTKSNSTKSKIEVIIPRIHFKGILTSIFLKYIISCIIFYLFLTIFLNL